MGPEQQATRIDSRLSALLDLVGRVYGTEEMVLKAGKLEALLLIRSQKPAQQLLGLQRLLFEDPTLSEAPAEEEYGAVITDLEGVCRHDGPADAGRIAEKDPERLEERTKISAGDKEIVREWTEWKIRERLKKYARAEKMFARQLSRSPRRCSDRRGWSRLSGRTGGGRACL